MQLPIWQDEVDDDRIGSRLVKAGLITEETLREAINIHKLWNCRLGEVLVARGHITAIDLAKALADQAGGSWVDLLKEPSDPSLLVSADRNHYIKHRYVPWRRVDGTMIVAAVAPSHEFEQALTKRYGCPVTLVYTGNFDVHWTVRKNFSSEYAQQALQSDIEKKAAGRWIKPENTLLIGLLLVFVMGLLFAPFFSVVLGMVGLLQASLFFGLTMILIGSSLFSKRKDPSLELTTAPEESADLPIYSVLVPFFGSAEHLAPLASSLRSLNYPLSHLDIKLLVNPAKADHIAEARRLRLESHFDIVPLPIECRDNASAAFNYGLQLVRGDYVMLCRSNDRPDPDQLRQAVEQFKVSNAAALEMKIAPHMRDQSVFSRLWSSMICLLQDVGRGLSDLGICVPVSGEGLHFRTDKLQELGGLDPKSGIPGIDARLRLAAKGEVVEESDSITRIAGPKEISPWISNRSRQYIGQFRHLGTILRHPLSVLDKFGIAGLLLPFMLFPAEFLLGILMPYFVLTIGVMISSLFINMSLPVLTGLGILPLANVLLSVALLMRANRLHPALPGRELRAFPIIEHIMFQMAASWLALSTWLYEGVLEPVSRTTAPTERANFLPPREIP